MNELPVYADLIIRQGEVFTLPYILTEELYDDVLQQVVGTEPWDTTGRVGRFLVKPVIAEGEFGPAVLDVSSTAGVQGQVVMGLNGAPGLEVSVFVWVPSSFTATLQPWGIGAYTTWVDDVIVGQGTVRLQRT